MAITALFCGSLKVAHRGSPNMKWAIKAVDRLLSRKDVRDLGRMLFVAGQAVDVA